MTTQTYFHDLNDNYHSNYYFGIPKDDFWVLFLKCHDRNNNRLAFIKDLERSILIANGKCPDLTTLSVCWHKPTNHPQTFLSWFGAPRSLGYSQTYSRLRATCAKHFGVKVKKIRSLPITEPVAEIRKRAARQEYFATRNLQG